MLIDNRKPWLFVASLTIAVVFSNVACAATFCVSNSRELTDALSNAVRAPCLSSIWQFV